MDGKPKSGSITLGRGNDTDGDGKGDGAGFFIDPTPTDSSEFMGNIVNAFAGDAQGGSPAAGLSDLFTVTLLELTHTMGITSAGGLRYQTGGFLTNTGASDPAGNGSGFFWTFTGPDITALMTSFDSGGGGTNFGPGVHSAEGGAGETFGGLSGSEDSGNAFFESGRRYLASNLDALILKDAYDYDIAMPETFGTFYSVLNQSNGLLTVRGGSGGSADNITVTRDGGDIVVSVDIGNDVPGTGPTDAFVTRYTTGQVQSISVLAGDGNDRVTIGADVGVPVTVDGGSGDDVLIGGDVTLIGGVGNDYLYGSSGSDNLDGGSGNDTLYGLDGDDTLAGGGDDDEIYAGSGRNVVTDGSATT